MPLNCPINKIGIADCLTCDNNYLQEGWCTALCPPKNNRRLIRDIMTADERLTLLENQIVNIRHLESVEDISERLVSLEDSINEAFMLLEKMGKILEKANTLQETVNLTLSKFSKRIISLEDKKHNENNSF